MNGLTGLDIGLELIFNLCDLCLPSLVGLGQLYLDSQEPPLLCIESLSLLELKLQAVDHQLAFIRKRNLGKPALGVAAVLGALGWYLQRKRAQQVAY